MSTQRVSSMMSARLPGALLGVVAFVSLAMACGNETPTGAPRTLAVQPRVIVDGMVELSAVAGSRVVVDEVLFHAPIVTVRQPDGLVASLLAADDGPLLFRYDASSSDGFGDVLGGERRWTVRDVDGELAVGFAPLDARLPVMTELEHDTGVKLADLRGHTATVHGYLLMSAPDATALGNDCEGDPDGNPALCAPRSDAQENDGDPDGNPSEGDPDGNPAKPAEKGEGDPDGNPAKADDEAEGDPDGNPADGDPDGNPSHDPEAEATRTGQALTRAERGPIRAVDGRVPSVKVPFLLVLNRAFSLHVPVAELFQTRLDDDEVRPLELHVRLDELLSEQMLELLNDEATDQAPGKIVIEIPDAEVGLDVDGAGVTRRVRESVTTGGIRVVGGH